MKVTIVTTATKTREFKRAPTNLSQEESELVSEYAIVAIDDTDEEEESINFEASHVFEIRCLCGYQTAELSALLATVLCHSLSPAAGLCRSLTVADA
ncbi:hypothetical protein LWI28_005872 [Acer negundo]|uniref:Uncharacterized protein n=1 Tax=Acer negundo TaxID=4023 RepID=A0AAD5ISU7_ACENE|nr:hypothetical protein LWI28_005872 [Acer negundo]